MNEQTQPEQSRVRTDIAHESIDNPLPRPEQGDSAVEPPARLALCMECMHWWNAGTGKKVSDVICPDDREMPRSHRVALYDLAIPNALRRSS